MEHRLAAGRRRPVPARDPRFFVCYTTATDNRIACVRRGSAARPVPVVTGIPRGRTHKGGRLMLDRDGLLWAGTGDAGDSATSQDTRSLGAKVLRVTASGAAAPGNRSGRVYSYGHRDVQGLAQDRGTTVHSATAMSSGTYGRLRDVARNPEDGSVWLLTSNNGLSGTDRPGDDTVLRFTRWP